MIMTKKFFNARSKVKVKKDNNLENPIKAKKIVIKQKKKKELTYHLGTQ